MPKDCRKILLQPTPFPTLPFYKKQVQPNARACSLLGSRKWWKPLISSLLKHPAQGATYLEQPRIQTHSLRISYTHMVPFSCVPCQKLSFRNSSQFSIGSTLSDTSASSSLLSPYSTSTCHHPNNSRYLKWKISLT